jgi:aspartyl-tRNA(Asn)/glutamyl-tRNA(Gln) amidotransferase subunit A
VSTRADGEGSLSLAALARAIAARRLSPVEVVDAALERIERMNPVLNAYLTVNPRARVAARAAERTVAAGRPLGPLHGVPISVKDLILTRGMPTTAGSRVFGNGLPGDLDAAVVRRLRRAGAIILGKTNLHEIAMGVTTVNEHFGAARNPWDRERIAGGSSGGSAVAVAAGLDWGSVGTDTRGSIRIPAAACGVTGLKPTYGLVPTEGVVPLSPSLDHVGPLARSVEDAAILLGVMAGRGRLTEAWRAALDAPVTGLRLGVCEYWLGDLDPAIAAAVRDALALFRRAGCEVQEVSLPELEGAQEASGVITSAEAIAWHDEHLRRNAEGYGPLVRARLERGRDITALAYLGAVERQQRLARGFDRVFGEVDCLVGAVLPAFPPGIEEDRPVLEAFTRLNSPANMGGVPALALPAGAGENGLPIGLQLMAGRGREEVLFRLGAWYQRETGWHLRRPLWGVNGGA